MRKNSFRRTMKKSHIIAGSIAVICAVFIVIFSAVKSRSISELFSFRIPSKEIINNWNEGNYKAVYDLADAYLQKNPVATDVLMFKGFAAYYIGMAQIEETLVNKYIDECIFNLRNILDSHEEIYNTRIYYLLGKAYYQKGAFYADLASQYLEFAHDSGFQAADLAEYRGLAFAQLGDYESSLSCFTEALVDNPTDLLLYSIALNYYNLGNIEMAAQYLLQIFDTSNDENVVLKSHQMMADIYVQKADWQKAETEYMTILEKVPDSADALYGLGVVYEGGGDLVKARASWRKALKADRYHKLTRDKLESK